MAIHELILKFLCRCVKLLFVQKTLQQPTTTKIFSGICLGIWRHEGGEEERGISLADSLCMPCVWFTMGSSEIMNKKENKPRK